MKYLFKIIEYGLYLLAFLLPIQTRLIIKAGELNGGPWEYGTISLYATDVLLIIVLLLFSVCEIARPNDAVGQASLTLAMTNKRCNNKIILCFVGGLLLISAVSVLFSFNKFLALYKLGWFILGIGLFWLIISANYNKLKLIYAMLVGIFLQAILGIWQFLIQSSFANKWLGLAAHNPAQLGTSVVELIAKDGIGERWLRAYGGLDHPNMLGGVLAVGILLIVFLFLDNKNSELKIKYKKAIFYSLFFIFITALFFTFSRGAWLAVLAGGFFMLISFVIKRDLQSQKEMLIAILLSSILIGVLFFQYNELVITRLGDNSRLEIKSRIERVASYNEALQIIKKYPLIGVGLGNYTLALSREIPNQESFYYQPTHNVFLLVFAETGIIGLLFFVGLIIIMFVRLLRRCASRNDMMVAIIIVLIVIMSLDHWFFSLHFGVLFFWLVLGLMISEKEKSLNPPASL